MYITQNSHSESRVLRRISLLAKGLADHLMLHVTRFFNTAFTACNPGSAAVKMQLQDSWCGICVKTGYAQEIHTNPQFCICFDTAVSALRPRKTQPEVPDSVTSEKQNETYTAYRNFL